MNTDKLHQKLSAEEILYKYWGYHEFRFLQKEIIDSILSGNDTMGLMPTGGGKSITFQVPAIMSKGTALVITPILSLMKDQVDNLSKRGIKAIAINSTMSGSEINEAFDNCAYGEYKLLYCSPERLSSKVFKERIKYLDISFIVIDECHCISQWGYDFRPSYLDILDIRPLFPKASILALTATATPPVIKDIQQILGFKNGSKLFKKSFFRDNLCYSVRYTEDKLSMMTHILDRVNGSAIIYCRSRQLTQELSQYLNAKGIISDFYHAGLSNNIREKKQDDWQIGKIRVIVATNAFGMGIDKSDVRIVIHHTMPNSLEEYYQEAGRAGRDGKKSFAVALIDKDEKTRLKRRISDSFPDKEYIKYTYDKLCNYLGIGEGDGFLKSYSFDKDDFIHSRKMRPVQTMSAIEILQTAGVLIYNQSKNQSRILILYQRERLYEDNVGFDAILRCIMRLYTGLFSDYVFINETDIATYCGISTDEVYQILMIMNRVGIIHYIPKSNTPTIKFLIRRERADLINITKGSYEDRKKRMKKRLDSVIAYISNINKCRSKTILNYFEESTELDCEICDVCLNKKNRSEKITDKDITQCYNYIRNLVDNGQNKIIFHKAEKELGLSQNILCNIIEHLMYYDKNLDIQDGYIIYN